MNAVAWILISPLILMYVFFFGLLIRWVAREWRDL